MDDREGASEGSPSSGAMAAGTTGAAPRRRRFAFPRPLRVRKRADFLRVQDAPAFRVRTPGFVVLAVADGATTRVGVVASKRLGGAVRRNRAKRLLREHLRRRLQGLPPGLTLVVIAQAPLLSRAHRQLEEDMERAARELGRFARRAAEGGMARGAAAR